MQQRIKEAQTNVDTRLVSPRVVLAQQADEQSRLAAGNAKINVKNPSVIREEQEFWDMCEEFKSSDEKDQESPHDPQNDNSDHAEESQDHPDECLKVRLIKTF